MMERVEQQLGNYRLKQVLGKGAFADIYLGEHLYLNTSAAVKVLHSRLDSPTLADFLTEARHISHLVHPHIIRVFDFGLESDIPFLVMDYAPHGNLREVHPPGMTVPLPLVVTYTKALASALQHAHDQHLVHRELKPENVLLGQNYEVLLCDFGLALLTSHRGSLQVRERFGPLSYMAPELIRGQPVLASDQYALAVMAYEWLCGHLPFAGLATHIANQHLYAVPPSLCEAHPDISRGVEQVLLKGPRDAQRDTSKQAESEVCSFDLTSGRREEREKKKHITSRVHTWSEDGIHILAVLTGGPPRLAG